eukprot:GILK01002829.1.p1 GENE.GILK01002829.1~~GILK01002829.1.p1  ORF type:complete len:514 (+),score=89.11 GILK01002829.1:189-1544(+)
MPAIVGEYKIQSLHLFEFADGTKSVSEKAFKPSAAAKKRINTARQALFKAFDMSWSARTYAKFLAANYEAALVVHADGNIGFSIKVNGRIHQGYLENIPFSAQNLRHRAVDACAVGCSCEQWVSPAVYNHKYPVEVQGDGFYTALKFAQCGTDTPKQLTGLLVTAGVLGVPIIDMVLHKQPATAATTATAAPTKESATESGVESGVSTATVSETTEEGPIFHEEISSGSAAIQEPITDLLETSETVSRTVGGHHKHKHRHAPKEPGWGSRVWNAIVGGAKVIALTPWCLVTTLLLWAILFALAVVWTFSIIGTISVLACSRYASRNGYQCTPYMDFWKNFIGCYDDPLGSERLAEWSDKPSYYNDAADADTARLRREREDRAEDERARWKPVDPPSNRYVAPRPYKSPEQLRREDEMVARKMQEANELADRQGWGRRYGQDEINNRRYRHQ